jgi:uncharacterized protein (DUF58 family)
VLGPELVQAIRHIEIRSRRLVAEDFAGEYQAVFKGRGIEFEEVRAYQPGDEIRTIDWNVTARIGSPHVKRFVEERELTVMLAFDASSSGQFGTVERTKRDVAAELGAVLAFSAISNNDKVGLLIFTDSVELHIPPRKGRRHVLRLIRELLAYEPQGRRTDIALALQGLNHTLKRRAIIFLLSDFLVPFSDRPSNPKSGVHNLLPVERAMMITNRRHDLVAVALTDPREVQWPVAGLVALEDAETGAVAWIDSSDAVWRETFFTQAATHRAHRDAAFSQARVDCVDVMVGRDYVAPLRAFFDLRAQRLVR